MSRKWPPGEGSAISTAGRGVPGEEDERTPKVCALASRRFESRWPFAVGVTRPTAISTVGVEGTPRRDRSPLAWGPWSRTGGCAATPPGLGTDAEPLACPGSAPKLAASVVPAPRGYRDLSGSRASTSKLWQLGSTVRPVRAGRTQRAHGVAIRGLSRVRGWLGMALEARFLRRSSSRRIHAQLLGVFRALCSIVVRSGNSVERWTLRPVPLVRVRRRAGTECRWPCQCTQYPSATDVLLVH